MQLFSVDATIIFRQFKKKIGLENMNKIPSKAAHNRPRTFFQYWPGCPNQAWPKRPKKEIPYHQKPLNAGLDI